MNPGNKVQTPIGSIKPDDTWMDAIQLHNPCQEALSERGIMEIGRREQKEER